MIHFSTNRKQQQLQVQQVTTKAVILKNLSKVWRQRMTNIEMTSLQLLDNLSTDKEGIDK